MKEAKMFMNIVLTISAVWLIGTSLMLKTKNLASSIVFKIVPFFIGLSCLIALLNHLGVVVRL